MKKLLPVLLIILLLSGCAAEKSVTAATPVPSAAPTAQAVSLTPAPDATPSPSPTPSPTPEPTAIPTPSPTPEPTPTPEAEPMTLEEVDALLREKGAVCAIAYLGRSEKPLTVGAPALLAAGGYNWRYAFLGSGGTSQLVEWNGSEVYALIPRSDARLTVYSFYINKDYSFTDGPADCLTVSQGTPVLLRCNESVTVPNTVLYIDAPGQAQIRYNPRITLSDSLPIIDSENLLDLTITDFQLDF